MAPLRTGLIDGYNYPEVGSVLGRIYREHKSQSLYNRGYVLGQKLRDYTGTAILTSILLLLVLAILLNR